MRLSYWLVPFGFALSLGQAVGQDGERFAERTPLPRKPPEHTMQRAGNTHNVAWWAVPSVSRHESGGYVGGGTLRGHPVLARDPAAGTGAPGVGTIGYDFAGFRMRPGRVFLSPSADPSVGSTITKNYRTEGPLHVPDVLSLRPFRKAVLEKKEDQEERRGGGEH